jgi:hypothetical protein
VPNKTAACLRVRHLACEIGIAVGEDDFLSSPTLCDTISPKRNFMATPTGEADRAIGENAN